MESCQDDQVGRTQAPAFGATLESLQPNLRGGSA